MDYIFNFVFFIMITCLVLLGIYGIVTKQHYELVVLCFMLAYMLYKKSRN